MNSRQLPIPPASEPMQYRAIGLIRGSYVPSEEQFTRGMLVTEDEVPIDAVLLGRVMSLVKKHVDLEAPHLWVVYPRTRNNDDNLHAQIVGIWEPENLNRDLTDLDDEADEDLDDQAADDLDDASSADLEATDLTDYSDSEELEDRQADGDRPDPSDDLHPQSYDNQESIHPQDEVLDDAEDTDPQGAVQAEPGHDLPEKPSPGQLATEQSSESQHHEAEPDAEPEATDDTADNDTADDDTASGELASGDLADSKMAGTASKNIASNKSAGKETSGEESPGEESPGDQGVTGKDIAAEDIVDEAGSTTSADESSTDELSTDEPSADELSTDEPSADEPSASHHSADEPAIDPAKAAGQPAKSAERSPAAADSPRPDESAAEQPAPEPVRPEAKSAAAPLHHASATTDAHVDTESASANGSTFSLAAQPPVQAAVAPSEAIAAPETAVGAAPTSAELRDGYFSIRGEVVKQDPEIGEVTVKIRQAPKKGAKKQGRAFNLKLKGTLGGRAVGYFWDLQVQRDGNALTVQDGTMIGLVPPKKRRKGGPSGRKPWKGGPGPKPRRFEGRQRRPGDRTPPSGDRDPSGDRAPLGDRPAASSTRRAPQKPVKRQGNSRTTDS